MKGERSGSAFPAWAPLALLIGLTAFAYLPSLANGFIWDDDVSLTQNPFIRSDTGLHDFWVTTLTPDYWPVTATTLWAEWRLWGMNPLGYHVTNLVLHVAEVLLLWTILRRLEVPGATLAALLFALHPVNVESVAWITQRKNLLAMLFYLLSLLAFLRAGERFRAAYWLSLLALALGMLAKGSVAVLPVVLLGLIAWRRPLRAGDFLRVAPFFAVAGALTLVNIWFQGHHLAAAETIRRAGGLERLLGAGAAVWFYLSKALLPIRLILPYPQWWIDAANPAWWLPLLGVLGISLWLGWRVLLRPLNAGFGGQISGRRVARPEIWRPVLFAWAYFCVALIPVLGFTDVNFMKFSLVADHYQHLALIGVTTLAGAGWAEWRRGRPGGSPWAVAAVAVILLGSLTWSQCLRYRDMGTFFEATLRQNPDSAMAHLNLGLKLGSEQHPQEALAHFTEAVRLDPGSAEAHSNLGAALVGQGRVGEGMAQYAAALRLKPDLFIVHLNLGSLLLHEGRVEEAEAELAAAVRLKPAFPDAHALLGDAWLRLGRRTEAVAEYEAALRRRPGDPQFRARLERARPAGSTP